MTPNFAQITALTAYGNDYLSHGNLPEGFYPANTTFQFCNHIDFRVFRAKSSGETPIDTLLAENPAAWFQSLKAEGCKKLCLFYKYAGNQPFTPEAQLAGLTDGAGQWMIEAVYDTWSNYWSAYWEITQPTAPGHKIWTVTYRLTQEQKPVCNLQIDPLALRQRLKKTLSSMIALADREQVDALEKRFHNARAILETEQPHQYYYLPDLIPAHYASLAARQLLFAALSAPVFGGRDSEDNVVWEREEARNLYNRLSAELYEEVSQAVVAVVNS